ncbi:3-deoxy-D-manno-octulosonic acid transferase [Roseovarius sp. MMSF_3281]|uniref:3-deoxy-D-manno-octulosonic acid transferase n=1 Tax=Roseovarius sp. MMSF_3281 TaxID=3046694 RepID=UPI00273E1167|nr:3-deoxy-D-manno-octulosonic acid transferase [Roseovarius sp. MMSF_3281]
MSGPAVPLPVRLYGVAANLIAPLAYRRVRAKLAAQGTPAARVRERLGRATLARPEGRLLWFHAASVGESLSVLHLIEEMGRQHPDLSFLITSGTATSAQIVGNRLPPRTQHQFAPLDSRRAVARFLDHWRPEAGVFVESELWPNMLRGAKAHGLPLALVNARISDNSARNWKRLAKTAHHLLGHFTLIHCQDTRTARHFHEIGITHAAPGVNLKSLSGALPHDTGELTRLQDLIGPRPLWLAASTHPGEDEVMIEAHKTLLKDHPEALLILVPRHPERADKIEAQLSEAGLDTARRSTGMPLEAKTQTYLADTLGEMGLWYALAPITCLCGSFTPVGGHNPYEPAHAGSALLHGPLYANFSETYADLATQGAATEVTDATALAQALHHLLTDAQALDTARDQSRAFAAAQADALHDVAETLSKALWLG